MFVVAYAVMFFLVMAMIPLIIDAVGNAVRASKAETNRKEEAKIDRVMPMFIRYREAHNLPVSEEEAREMIRKRWKMDSLIENGIVGSIFAFLIIYAIAQG